MNEAAIETYRNNIEALRRHQPDVAALIDSASLDGFSPATGRDGAVTFRVSRAGRQTWFGGSSMPSISSEALAEAASPQGGNIVLPAIMTGRECVTLAHRMPPHCAVFVIERDAHELKAALHVQPMHDLLSLGRVVLLVEGALEDQLKQLFARHPGYQPPERVLTIPQRSSQEITGMTRLIEVIVPRVLGQRQATLNEATQRLQKKDVRAIPDRPRVAIVGTDVRPLSFLHMERLVRALASLECPTAHCLPDRPGHSHDAARIACIAEAQADLVIFINSVPGAIREALPERMSVISWYAPGAQMPEKAPAVSGADRLVVSSRDALQRFADGHESSDSIVLLEPAACNEFADEEQGTDDGCREIDVFVMADLPDDRPESLGIRLKSQLALWEALRQAAQRAPDLATPDRADAMLKDAERSCGVRISEDSLREQFARLLRLVIAPAARARAVVRTAASGGFRVRVGGSGWYDLPPEVTSAGRISERKEFEEQCRRAGAIVFPAGTEADVGRALDAILLRRPVAVWGSLDGLRRNYPALAEITSSLHPFAAVGELAPRLEQLLKPCGGAELEDARRAILSGQTVADRLRTLFSNIRGLPSIQIRSHETHALADS